MTNQTLTLNTKNYSSHVLHLYRLTLADFKLTSGFFRKIDLFAMKKIDPEPLTYAGRDEMVEVLKMCYKCKISNLKPYSRLVIDNDVEVMWDIEKRWEYDFTKPINRK